jgi:hypothetical protein
MVSDLRVTVVETRLVAKIIFLADHTYLYKIGFW